MPKMKTHKSAAKRYKVTATGKIVRRQAGIGHLLQHKSASRKRRIFKTISISDSLERFDEAIEAAEKALEFGEDGVVYYWLACCYEAKEEYSKALEYINKSILLGENDCWTFWHKSSIMGALGKNKEAEIAYKKAVELGFVESV